MKKNILTGPTRHMCLQTNRSKRPKQKKNAIVLVNEEEICFWFARVQLLFYLNPMTTLDLENAELLSVQHYKSKLQPDNVDTVSSCI